MLSFADGLDLVGLQRRRWRKACFIKLPQRALVDGSTFVKTLSSAALRLALSLLAAYR